MTRSLVLWWKRLAVILIASIVLCGHREPYEDYREMDRYDRYFRQYGAKYFGSDFDWRYFKAQAIAESRLRKKARSHDGAMGVMQILPSTFTEIRNKNPDIPDAPWSPKWNIAAAIYYDRMLWETWQAERAPKERLKFMFGSYNAGAEAILEAQQKALEADLAATHWRSIEKMLPRVLGDAAEETIHYVADIFVIRKALPPKQNNSDGKAETAGKKSTDRGRTQ